MALEAKEVLDLCISIVEGYGFNPSAWNYGSMSTKREQIEWA